MLYHYQDQGCPQAVGLLEEEIITYSVLGKILQGPCANILTDMENYIVCHSSQPWPVWVWCRDVENDNSVMEIAQCIKEKLPLEQGYVHNMSYELLEKLREKDAYFIDTKEEMGLLSYRLDAINAVNYPCEGYMSRVRQEEIDSLIGVWHDMHIEMESRALSPEHCRDSIHRMVGEESLFAWRLADGTIVALTGRGDQGEYSKITSVYTLPEHRRKGYAINLVYRVTETILAHGLIPILYTNADYAASNDCYQKIGYRQVGRLISIGKKCSGHVSVDGV